ADFTPNMSKNGHSADRGASGSSAGGGFGASALFALVLRRKIFFILPIVCALLSVSIIHFWLPVYEARTSLIVQTANSSSLLAVSARMSSFGMQEDET